MRAFMTQTVSERYVFLSNLGLSCLWLL